MSRLGAAVGAGLGGVAGAAAGYYGNRAIRRGTLGYQAGGIDPMLAEMGGALVGGSIGAAIGAGSSTPKQVGTSGVGEMTPAQAAGEPDFVTDVPVQGPTDQGMREADCRFVRERIPTQPNCVDCEGPIPMWARQNLSVGGRANYSGVGEQISFGGVGVAGFALSGPDIWQSLTAAQQAWVTDTLVKLNEMIVKATGTSCPTWAPNIMAAGQCFQQWFNAAGMGLTKPDGSPVVLRTDGIFDQDTLDALRTVVALHPSVFTTPFPGTEMAGTGGGEKKGLSKGAIAGIAVGSVLLVGGGAYAIARSKKRSR